MRENLGDRMRGRVAVVSGGARGIGCAIADAVMFFAGDASAFVSGAELVADVCLTVRGHWPLE